MMGNDFEEMLKEAKSIKTVDEAVQFIIDNSNTKEIDLLKKYDELEIGIKCHHNMGQLIRNRMGLWAENKALRNDCLNVMKTTQKDKCESYSKHWRDYSCDEHDYERNEDANIHADDASCVIISALWKKINKVEE